MTTRRPLYQALATKVSARMNCMTSGKDEWFYRHQAEVERLVSEHLPSGSGFDAGTKIDWDKSTGERLVFQTSFHHMNDAGMYDGWTEHTVTVRPSLMFGYDLLIGGRNRNDIKDYIADAFHHALRALEPVPAKEAAHV